MLMMTAVVLVIVMTRWESILMNMIMPMVVMIIMHSQPQFSCYGSIKWPWTWWLWWWWWSQFQPNRLLPAFFPSINTFPQIGLASAFSWWSVMRRKASNQLPLIFNSFSFLLLSILFLKLKLLMLKRRKQCLCGWWRLRWHWWWWWWLWWWRQCPPPSSSSRTSEAAKLLFIVVCVDRCPTPAALCTFFKLHCTAI